MTTSSHARASVLAALARRGSYASDVRLWCNILADTAVAVKAGEDGVAVGWTYPHRDLREVVAWTVESPALGVEVLSERGLWPWAPGDVDAPRWWCDRCDGGRAASEAMARGVKRICGDCFNEATLDTPPSLSALVAVASLGAATLLRVAELVRELHAVTRGETGAALVWQVMTRDALREHYQRETTTYAREEPFGRYLCKVFAHESFGPAAGHPPWPEASTYVRSRTAAAWPILRALAVHEDGAPTGLHLVAADRERVVIAVEAV